ncbi:MAG: hypothetical protein NC112_09670 [Oxalobacter formigenes]|nr:hypothetical protein [Oxalobacter formigenes]
MNTLQEMPRQQVGALAASDQQRAIAEVQAAMMIARANPRNEQQSINKIINAFSRPSLAEASTYEYSRGGTAIIGPSIRTAEAIAQLWGNLQFGFREIQRGKDMEGIGFSEVEAVAWDVENNTKRVLQFQVRHWRDTKKGGYPITDERDIYELVANQAQRRVRSCILAVIPGDVVETALEQARTTLTASADTSAEALKKMIERFAEYDVNKEQIEKFIQRHLSAITPAQVIRLRHIFNSIKDGMSKASDWFDTPEKTEEEKPASRTEALKEKVRKAAEVVDAKPAEVVDAENTTAPAATPDQIDTVSPSFSFAEVNDRLMKAKTMDELDEAADMIALVPNPAHQDELRKVYQGLKKGDEA